MKTKIDSNSFIIIFTLVYLSISLASAQESTRQRIAYHKKWLQERRPMKKNIFLRSPNVDAGDRFLSTTKYRPSMLNHRKKNLWNDTKSSKYFNENQLDAAKRQNAVQNDIFLRSSQAESENDITYTMPTTATTMAGETMVPVQNELSSARRRTDLLASTITSTMPTNRMADVTPISIPALADHNDVVKAVIENPAEPPSINRTRVVSRTIRRMVKAAWGRWHPWTTCSRSCGGGVMSQTRECLSRGLPSTARNRTSNECIGLYKRYRICNEQSCPDHEIDFREQQCVQYNNQTFRGKTYSWEAYIKDDAECELNCKPIGLNYFATLNNTVIDGTTCYLPVDFARRNVSGRAMCVDGICKAVRNSGIITGAFMNNGAVRCGGLVCRPVSGVFTKNQLPNGYVHIATIPAGASNISILELKNSENLLVLKRADQTFIINGDHVVSDSGDYAAAGALFDYRRIDGTSKPQKNENEGVTEWITATGPITEQIYLMILNQEKNPGVKYEYLLPINAPPSNSSTEENNSVEMEADMPPAPVSTTIEPASKASKSSEERRRRRYIWKVVSFSSCSKSCGGGTVSPIIRCVREGMPNKFFNHKRCADQDKPVLNENILRCNTQPCPAYWKIEEWTACNCGLPNEHEHQTREIKCVQELASGVVIQVVEAACLDEQPAKQQNCACPKAPNSLIHHQHHTKRNHHNHHHTKGSFRAPVTLIGNSTIGKRIHVTENKHAGVWLSAEWGSDCPTKCGDGVQYRSIFCDRSHPNTERCDLRLTPDTSRQCSVSNHCDVGEWFTGPWSKCSGSCFSLTRSRAAYCMKNKQIVADTECIDSNDLETTSKPLTTEACELNDVTYCKPRWHYSEWTECTKACGSGTQRRTIKCLEPNTKEKLLKETDNCRYSERLPAFRNCNTYECENSSHTPNIEVEEEPPVTRRRPAEPKVEMIQNDSLPACTDKFPNCHMVIQAKLCTYGYYADNCCATCKEAMEMKL